MKSYSHFPIARIALTVFLAVIAFHASGNPMDPVMNQEEARRVQLVSGLVAQRAKLVRAQNIKELQACDQEIKRHPAPAESDTSTLLKLLAGKWRSPRHDYLYRPDGTWTMLPAEKGILHGRWRISGNQVEVTSGYATPESTDRYTLILLTGKDYVYTDGESVFCETRLAK